MPVIVPHRPTHNDDSSSGCLAQSSSPAIIYIVTIAIDYTSFFFFCGRRIEFSVSTCSGVLSLPHACSYNIITPQFRTSHLFVSTHFHILITYSLFPSSWPNHLSLTSLMFSLMFATPALAHISSFLIFSILFIPIIQLSILIFFLARFTYIH